MASTRQEIYDGKGARIGWIESDERGNKRVYSFSKGLVGFYYKDTNRTGWAHFVGADDVVR